MKTFMEKLTKEAVINGAGLNNPEDIEIQQKDGEASLFFRTCLSFEAFESIMGNMLTFGYNFNRISPLESRFRAATFILIFKKHEEAK